MAQAVKCSERVRFVVELCSKPSICSVPTQKKKTLNKKKDHHNLLYKRMYQLNYYKVCFWNFHVLGKYIVPLLRADAHRIPHSSDVPLVLPFFFSLPLPLSRMHLK